MVNNRRIELVFPRDIQSTSMVSKARVTSPHLTLRQDSVILKLKEKDRDKKACRDADGLLYDFTRAGFDLTVLPAAFTRREKTSVGHLVVVFSRFDDILIAGTSWDEHLALLVIVLQRLLEAIF